MHFLNRLKAWCQRQLAEIAAAAPYPLTDDEWQVVKDDIDARAQTEQLEQELALERTRQGKLVVNG